MTRRDLTRLFIKVFGVLIFLSAAIRLPSTIYGFEWQMQAWVAARVVYDLPVRHSVDSAVQPFLQKYFASSPGRNTFKPHASRPHKRGVSRSSRTLGAGCGGRGGVTRRMTRPRTAKPCGPDAPTLASSLRDGDVSPNGPDTPRKRRWQKSPVTGESAE